MTEIWVRFTVPGFHLWPAAPAPRNYLGHRHRHLFGFEVGLGVEQDDREIEFHDLLDAAREDVARLWPGGEFGPRSCEAIARGLAEQIRQRWPGRLTAVSVSEDGECGARVTL